MIVNKYWEALGGVTCSPVHPDDGDEIRNAIFAKYGDRACFVWWSVGDPFWKNVTGVLTLDEESDTIARMGCDGIVEYVPKLIGRALRDDGCDILTTTLTPL